MSLTFPLHKPPLTLSFNRLTLTPSPPKRPSFLTIRALKIVTGTVVFAGNDKTVSVEVTRLKVMPKYKNRMRIKKKFQAHDPDNRFKEGDVVVLEKCRPISKMKSHLALPFVPKARGTGKQGKGKKAAEESGGEGVLEIPFESESVEESGGGGGGKVLDSGFDRVGFSPISYPVLFNIALILCRDGIDH
ncbi:Small ribosomal subunit protein uS17c-like protein [Drosera capensis]